MLIGNRNFYFIKKILFGIKDKKEFLIKRLTISKQERISLSLIFIKKNK